MDESGAIYYPPTQAHPMAYYPPPPPSTSALAFAPLPHSSSCLHEEVPPVPFTTYVPAYATHTFQDTVRTLFIAGLPDDVKPREIYNLFREFPGFESSQFRSPTRTSQPFAFATFLDFSSAAAAMHALNGLAFDLEKGSTLYIDLARSNSKSKRLRADDEWLVSNKKDKGSIFPRAILDSGYGSIHLPGLSHSSHSMIGYPSAQSQADLDARTENEFTSVKFSNSSATPCPTLFVANLGSNCTEKELIQVFSNCPGFLKLKMQSTYGAHVAFIDFQDTACSSGALDHLQGSILHSSSSGQGMRLEYAKSRMGLRKKSLKSVL